MFLQSLKAEAPMCFTDDGIVISSREVQFEKAESPIDLRFFEKISSFKFEQPLKAECSIFLTVKANSTLVKVWLKANFPFLITGVKHRMALTSDFFKKIISPEGGFYQYKVGLPIGADGFYRTRYRV